MASQKKFISELELITEWDWEKNEEQGYDPNKISHGSTKYVYWRCMNGHSYKARIDHRTIMGSSCPYCAGKLPIITRGNYHWFK